MLYLVVTLVVGLGLSGPALSPEPTGLTLEDRLRSQEAIERVYHEHRVGESRPFEEAVPRHLLREKVQDYLALSDALELVDWSLVSPEAIRQERERIEQANRTPGRLEQLYAALGNDRVLIDECLIRPVLVARLATRAAEPLREDPGAVLVDRLVEGLSKFVPQLGGAEEACTLDDGWTSMNQSGAPTPRSEQTAVWTGNYMIVWGGDLTAATGGRYDPGLDSWTPTGLTNAPSPREGHSAVWTGEEMIVWGGRNGSNYYDDGSLYDPISNSWTPLDAVIPPEIRAYHSAVWTGEEMIVWGGENRTSGEFGEQCGAFLCCGDYLTSGGRYDPDSETWFPTSEPGVLYGVSRHSAVWTDEEMIVFGGRFFNQHPDFCYDAENVLWIGGRYDPKSDTWVAIFRAPAASYDHSAVWTGETMIACAGTYPIANLYDPTTDSWFEMSEEGAAPGTWGASVVWTGDRLIVWPRAMISAPSEIRSRITPCMDMNRKVPEMVMNRIAPTISPLRSPMKNSSTTMTIATASIRLIMKA